VLSTLVYRRRQRREEAELAEHTLGSTA